MKLNMEPQVIESIRDYRRNVALQKALLLAPLLLGIIACMAILIVLTAIDAGDWKRVFTGDNGGVAFLLWVPFMALAALLFLLAWRNGPEEFVIVPEAEVEAGSPAPFRQALEGLSAAAGFPVPPLYVARIPTVNSLAFLRAGKPAVGVSLEAVEANLGPRRVEAMMAHELAHILTGELFPASSRRRFQLIGWGMICLLPMLVVMLTLMAGLRPWAGLAMLAAVPLLLFWAAWRSRFIGRHNGLLADSIAAKLTYDPAGLKETIEELDRLFMTNTMPFKPEARYPYYLFVYRVRPELELERARKMARTFYSREQEEDFAADMDKWITRMGRFPRDTMEMRLRNLEAIELGHWPAFEKK
jgi:Zn-dependent protease with chaperone function